MSDVRVTWVTGHGARIVVTETGTRADHLETARERRRTRLARLAEELASSPEPEPL